MIRILSAAFILVLLAQPAYAYIDVAIGSLILQALVGGFFAFLVIWRDWVAKVKNFFKGNGFVNQAAESPSDSEQ